MEWANREVELACSKLEKGNDFEKDYLAPCYRSALKAYESLMADNHSGASLELTTSILLRLLGGKPLTPIEDADGIWELLCMHDKEEVYQCKRMTSLFKIVYADGSVRYRDNNGTCIILPFYPE